MRTRELSPEELRLSQNLGIFVVHFYDDSSEDCKLIAKEIEKISDEGLYFHMTSFNVNRDKNLTREFNVETVPTLLVVREDEILGRKTGFMSADEIKEWAHFSTIMGW